MPHLKRIFFATMLLPVIGMAQRVDLDLFAGIANYQGDLQPVIFTFQNAQPAGAVVAKIGITENFYARAGISFGTLYATDAKNREELQFRNLNFKSGITDFHLGIEYRFFKPETFPITPYAFAGVGMMHFNPYTYYNINGQQEKIYLQPLGTEGQGLSQYADRQPYSLYQLCVPYGGGLKYTVNCNLNLGFEFRQTKVFTDYLDDVSTTYANEAALRNGNGNLAADIAWRADELSGAPYPTREGTTRGRPENADWYYFLGFTVGLRITDCETGQLSFGGIANLFGGGGGSKSGSGGGRNSRQILKCPKW